MTIIATYAGGVPSIIENKISGILIQDGNPYNLVGAIIELSKDEELKKLLATNAYQKAIISTNPINISEKMLIIYSNILVHQKILMK